MVIRRKGLEKGSTVSHAVSDEESNTETVTNTKVQLQSPKLQSDTLTTILAFCLPVLLKTKQQHDQYDQPLKYLVTFLKSIKLQYLEQI